MVRTTGSYQEVQGQPVVRFERTFPHPVSAVWEAVTGAAQLEQWFPTTVEFAELRPGAAISFRFPEDRYPPMRGEVIEVQPQRRLVFTWADDRLTFELAPHDGEPPGSACRLAFTVVLDSADKAARDSGGWDQCLDRLDRVPAGRAPEAPESGRAWRAYYEAYQRLGLPATAPLPE